MNRRLAWGIACVGLAAVAGCSGPEAVEPAERIEDSFPEVVVIYAACTVNTNYLEPYGSELGLTPNLSGFASDSAVMMAHRTEAGMSGIAYASIFTGRQADGHGAFRHPHRLSLELYDLSEALADNGYEVHYWGRHIMARPNLNYAQGAHVATDKGMTPEAVGKLVAAARKDPNRRVALITTFSVTHAPYNRQNIETFNGGPERMKQLTPERVKELAKFFYDNVYDLKYRHAEFIAESGLSDEDVLDLVAVIEGLYRMNVARLDRLFGATLEAVGEDAFVVFTADHGESLYDPEDQCQWYHGGSLKREVLETPLLVRGGEVEPGRYHFVTRSMDVAPTVAGLLGLELPEATGWAGVDLSPVLRGEAEPPRLKAFSHTGFNDERIPIQFAVRDGNLVAWYEEGAVSVRHVDDESRDIYDAGNPEHAALADALTGYRDRLTQAYTGEESLPAEESAEILRSLGYIE